MPIPLNRREMLRLSAAAGLAAGFSSVVVGQNPSKPIRLGMIGVGSRGTGLLTLALATDVEIVALCDIDPAALNNATELVAKARNGRKPVGYSNGSKDYQRMLQRDDLDAVIVAAPMQWHTIMSVEAMRAGKHVLSEVSGAMTVEECWGIVRATEETGKLYMLAENCCYYDYVMMIRNMVKQGLFGDLTYAECGYVHDCRFLLFKPDGTLTWRGELARDYAGNLYPTHSLGPVAQWMGINRGDRMVSLVAGCTGQKSLLDFVARQFPAGHPARQIRFKVADSTTVLIRTAKGAMIDLRYDVYSPRPVVSTTYFSLQGTKGSYESRTENVYIEGRSKDHTWDPVSKYAKEFEDPLWTRSRKDASVAGHGGCDYFAISEFVNMLRRGGPSPIDCYDAAAWSVILPLSAKSLAEGGAPQEIPDFTRGKWESRKS